MGGFAIKIRKVMSICGRDRNLLSDRFGEKPKKKSGLRSIAAGIETCFQIQEDKNE